MIPRAITSAIPLSSAARSRSRRRRLALSPENGREVAGVQSTRTLSLTARGVPPPPNGPTSSAGVTHVCRRSVPSAYHAFRVPATLRQERDERSEVLCASQRGTRFLRGHELIALLRRHALPHAAVALALLSFGAMAAVVGADARPAAVEPT